MNANDERTRSLWVSDVKLAPQARRLAEDLSCDVVIVGSGIAGLSVAYETSQIGKSVVVLDRGSIGGGMTSRTTAHLAPVCDDGVAALTKMRGEEMAAKFQASQAAAVDRIEAIVARHKINCGFRRLDAYLFPAPGMEFKEAREEQDEEYKALRSAKVDVEKAKGVKLKGLRGRTGPALQEPSDIPPAEISCGPHRANRGGGRASVLRQSRNRDRGTRARCPRQGGRWDDRRRRARRVRHQFTDLRLGGDSQQDGAVSHLRDGVRATTRRAAGCSLLGHGRPLSLCPHPAGPRLDGLFDRGRRRS